MTRTKHRLPSIPGLAARSSSVSAVARAFVIFQNHCTLMLGLLVDHQIIIEPGHHFARDVYD